GLLPRDFPRAGPRRADRHDARVRQDAVRRARRQTVAPECRFERIYEDRARSPARTRRPSLLPASVGDEDGWTSEPRPAARVANGLRFRPDPRLRLRRPRPRDQPDRPAHRSGFSVERWLARNPAAARQPRAHVAYRGN